MDAPYRIVACYETLIDLLLEPGWDRNPTRGEQYWKWLNALQDLIDCNQITVCVPPVLVAMLHLYVRHRRNGTIDLATQCVDRLLAYANCNLEVNYLSILKRANSATLVLSGVELYEVMCLAYAHDLKAAAFITLVPEHFQRIVRWNPIFEDFNVPIVDLGKFISHQNEQ